MSEKYYDEVVAPKLVELMTLCRDNGMNVVASVEYEPGKTGASIQTAGGCCTALLVESIWAQCFGNFDKFIMTLKARPELTKGHNSIFLSQLGIMP